MTLEEIEERIRLLKHAIDFFEQYKNDPFPISTYDLKRQIEFFETIKENQTLNLASNI